MKHLIIVPLCLVSSSFLVGSDVKGLPPKIEISFYERFLNPFASQLCSSDDPTLWPDGIQFSSEQLGARLEGEIESARKSLADYESTNDEIASNINAQHVLRCTMEGMFKQEDWGKDGTLAVKQQANQAKKTELKELQDKIPSLIAQRAARRQSLDAKALTSFLFHAVQMTKRENRQLRERIQSLTQKKEDNA